MGNDIGTNFSEKYKYLCKIYHKDYDEDECKEYYKRLQHYGNKKVESAFEMAINTNKFFPTISELNQIISELPPAWFNQNLTVKKPTIEERQELDNILNELVGQSDE